MAYKNIEDSRAYGKKWYHANKEKRVKQIRKWQQKQYEKVKEYKLSRGCSVCGYNKASRSLDFHHKTDNKESGIAILLGRRLSFERILVEIKKCEVLCKNCHGELHEKEDSKI